MNQKERSKYILTFFIVIPSIVLAGVVIGLSGEIRSEGTDTPPVPRGDKGVKFDILAEVIPNSDRLTPNQTLRVGTGWA
ncbi:MAG: hypothetical protein ABIH67_05100, partial [Candidatus Uhrbacteria bacterium]